MGDGVLGDGVLGDGERGGARGCFFWSRKLVALPTLDELSYTFILFYWIFIFAGTTGMRWSLCTEHMQSVTPSSCGPSPTSPHVWR